MNNCEMPYEENEFTLYNPIYEKINISPQKKVKEYLCESFCTL